MRTVNLPRTIARRKMTLAVLLPTRTFPLANILLTTADSKADSERLSSQNDSAEH